MRGLEDQASMCMLAKAQGCAGMRGALCPKHADEIAVGGGRGVVNPGGVHGAEDAGVHKRRLVAQGCAGSFILAACHCERVEGHWQAAAG